LFFHDFSKSRFYENSSWGKQWLLMTLQLQLDEQAAPTKAAGVP
jgi:hypothetical protein